LVFARSPVCTWNSAGRDSGETCSGMRQRRDIVANLAPTEDCSVLNNAE
jgi:hypothetical protein